MAAKLTMIAVYRHRYGLFFQLLAVLCNYMLSLVDPACHHWYSNQSLLLKFFRLSACHVAGLSCLLVACNYFHVKSTSWNYYLLTTALLLRGLLNCWTLPITSHIATYSFNSLAHCHIHHDYWLRVASAPCPDCIKIKGIVAMLLALLVVDLLLTKLLLKLPGHNIALSHNCYSSYSFKFWQVVGQVATCQYYSLRLIDRSLSCYYLLVALKKI